MCVDRMALTLTSPEDQTSCGSSFGSKVIPFLLEVLRKERDDNILYHVKETLTQVGWRPGRI